MVEVQLQVELEVLLVEKSHFSIYQQVPKTSMSNSGASNQVLAHLIDFWKAEK